MAVAGYDWLYQLRLGRFMSWCSYTEHAHSIRQSINIGTCQRDIPFPIVRWIVSSLQEEIIASAAGSHVVLAFHSLSILYFLHSTPVLSFYIDVVLTLSIKHFPTRWPIGLSGPYIHRVTWPPLVQVMACCLSGTKHSLNWCCRNWMSGGGGWVNWCKSHMNWWC